jgi:cysteine desulfurase
MPSHVLTAMGLSRRVAGGALRCTLGRATTAEEVDRAAAAIVGAVEQLRSASGVGAG